MIDYEDLLGVPVHERDCLRKRKGRLRGGPLQDPFHASGRFHAARHPAGGNGKYEIQPMRKKNVEVKPVEFDIPAEATAGGALTLEWQPDPAEAGNGRFVQVSEAWLIRIHESCFKIR